jgi:hypothetical protein
MLALLADLDLLLQEGDATHPFFRITPSGEQLLERIEREAVTDMG